jgi:hypothetical protein
VALSNLAGVRDMRKDYAGAERLFREVLRRDADVLPPGHQLVGIAHVRLGRTLLHAGRFAEAAAESRAGYDLLLKQSAPPKLWVDNWSEDLAAAAESLGRGSPHRAPVPWLTSKSPRRK